MADIDNLPKCKNPDNPNCDCNKDIPGFYHFRELSHMQQVIITRYMKRIEDEQKKKIQSKT